MAFRGLHMKRKLISTAVIAVAIVVFVGVGINDLHQSQTKIQIREVQLKDSTADLKELELKYDNLNVQLESVDKTKTEEVKKLQDNKAELERQLQEKEAQLQAKRAEKERLASLKTTATVSAATAPVRASGGVSGGCGAIRAKLASLGVPADQLDAAITLAMRESSCNEFAVNSNGGACGAFQSLPCGKWGSPGTDQYYRGAINYANSRYGGYNQALAFSLRNSWY